MPTFKRTYALYLLAIAMALPLAFNNCAPTGIDDTATWHGSTQTPIAPNNPDDSQTPQDYGDPDPGTGLWIPPGTNNRIVADPSGPSINRIVSYIPGCLNGGTANNSATGCAANSSFSGTIAGTNTVRTFNFGSGRQLVLRYRPKADAGKSLQKHLMLSSATGGAVGINVRIWLSTDPSATYNSVPTVCRSASSGLPFIGTGPGYCQVSASNPVYYFGIEYDDPTSLRFKVVDGTQTSDF